MSSRPRKPWTRKTFPLKTRKRRVKGKAETVTPNSNDARDIIAEGIEPVFLDSEGRIFGLLSPNHYLNDSLKIEFGDDGSVKFMWVWLPRKTRGKYQTNKRRKPLEDSFLTIDSDSLLLFPRPGETASLYDYWTRKELGEYTVVRFPERFTNKSVITSIILTKS